MSDQEHTEPDQVLPEEVSVVRSEEEATFATAERDVGKVRIRKDLERFEFDELVPYAVEHAEVERIQPHPDDSGEIETLPDGTVSIPVLSEQLVVEKRLVVTERLLVRKRVETKEQRVSAELTRQVVSIDADETVADRIHLEEK